MVHQGRSGHGPGPIGLRTMKRIGSLWLFLGVLGWAGAQGSDLSLALVNPPPGLYPSPLRLEVRAPEGAVVRYRFLETPSSQTFLLPSTLNLEAMAGETRLYTLRLTTDLATGETFTRDYSYQVAKAAEPMATVQPVPGVYHKAITLNPVLPPGWRVFEANRLVSFPLNLDSPLGVRQTFLFEARGPREERLSWSYVVDRRDQEGVELDILSPLPGAWANAQALLVGFRGVDRVLWSYGDRLNFTLAQDYSGPLLLDRGGTQTLTVAGRSRLDGRWVEKTVSWNNGTADPPVPNWPTSGPKPGGLDLPEAVGWSLSWDEGRSWEPSQVLHRETPSSVSRKILSVQARKGSQVSRFVYGLDVRQAQTPDLVFVGGWNPTLTFSGTNEAFYRVVWTLADGKTVAEPSGLWGPSGSWKVPDGVVAARVSAQSPHGLDSAVASMGFATTGWATPEWEPWDLRGPQVDQTLLPLGGRVVPRSGFWATYEVSDRPEVPEPGIRSPHLEGAFLPSIPWGADRTFYARFAWRDAAGLTGPASPVVAVRVDRVPPLAPEALEVGGQVLLKPAEGEEEGTSLFWAVTSERVPSADSLTFQPYLTALEAKDLRSSAGGKLWLHAQAQDRAGNSGPARLNVALAPASTETGPSVVQVDPDPAVGDSPVEDGGVYPWPQFRLRALDQGRDLWVAITDQGTSVPIDWKTRLQPWTGVLSRAVGRGERRTFVVFWNAKTTTGWAWPQPRSLTLTLDQGPPSRPTVEGVWPSAPQGQAWTLNLKPGRAGDFLRYSWTLDGSLPPDPLLGGESWPGTRSWDAPEGGKVTVRVRLASVSVSGLSWEIPLGDPVVIDRSPPAALVPTLEPFTYRNDPLTVVLPPGSGTVHYSLTSDGTAPGVPTASSPVLARPGLVLEGVAGQSVLYRFRWRTYSLAGLPGTVSDPFTVVVDRTSPVATSSSKVSVAGSLLPLPRVTGFPASSVSSAPVTLKADWSLGLVRYELREGVGTPRPVTLQSPVWEQPLVLDGGPGVDRSYAVSLKGFSPDGVPLTEETQYTVRIDRSIPRAPSFELIADSRRPEAVLEYPQGGRNPEEQLQYRWFWESFPQGSGQIDWQSLVENQPLFTSPGGALTRLRVQAFLRDEAGNEGPLTEKTLLIDQNVVYLSPKGTGDGTRNKPLGSVVEALEKSRREGRTILFVATGTFPVLKTVDLGGLEVFGGLSPEQWETTTTLGRSLWTATAPFQGASLLESGDRSWYLSRIDLAGTVPLSRFVVVRGAVVTVKNSAWSWLGALGGWDQLGGSIDWSDITVSYAAEPRGTFVDLRSVEASIRGFNLTASQNQGGLLFSLKGVEALFRDLVVVSKKASGFDGICSASDSSLTVDNARILAGEGASRATAFVFKDTEATFWNTEVALYGASANTGFQVTGGKLELQKTNLSLLKGTEFNQGIVADHNETVLRTFQLKIETGSYQGGLNVDGGSLNVSSTKIQLAGGGQRAWGAQFLDTPLVIFDDVSWVLGVKTPGEQWKMDNPWAVGSSEKGSTVSGW